MKLLTITYLLTISLCAGFCCPPEDDYESITILKNGLIQIENNKNTFNLGDKITISITIENEQISDTNKKILLTDYAVLNNNSAAITSSFILFKETNFNTLSKIPINSTSLTVVDVSLSKNYRFFSF